MKHRLFASLVVGMTALMLVFGAAFAASSSHKVIVKNLTVDGYALSLRVLPAEPFVKTADAKKSENSGKMVDGGGAMVAAKGGPEHPNHHLVVFIKKSGAPVEHAKVKITYQREGSKRVMSLPVVTMWVAGAGRKTTHYGNNVNLKPGRYEVKVTVNGKAKADFHIHL